MSVDIAAVLMEIRDELRRIGDVFERRFGDTDTGENVSRNIDHRLPILLPGDRTIMICGVDDTTRSDFAIAMGDVYGPLAVCNEQSEMAQEYRSTMEDRGHNSVICLVSSWRENAGDCRVCMLAEDPEESKYGFDAFIELHQENTNLLKWYLNRCGNDGWKLASIGFA